MDSIEKLQKEIELTRELLTLKEKLLEVEKQFGIQRIEYVPIYPQYPYYPYPLNPFYGTTSASSTYQLSNDINLSLTN
jgi:hypothetical protein